MSDLIDRQKVLNTLDFADNALTDGERTVENYKALLTECIKVLPSAENKGEWIYDKGIYNWRCSRCGQTPPPTGYCGKADFMATHYKFCSHCGADMRGET